jgi:6-phosphogluconate dehydrogenase (decarboxylating)
MPDQTKVGIIGLGKMGGNLALQAIDKDISMIANHHQLHTLSSSCSYSDSA